MLPSSEPSTQPSGDHSVPLPSTDKPMPNTVSFRPGDKSRLVKEYRLLKVWLAGQEKPGYRYALQQRVEVTSPKYADDGTIASEEIKRKWIVVGEGDEEWATANAAHYNLVVPTEEYILEDHQDTED